MSDGPTELVLVSLRRIEAKNDDMRADIAELKQRVTTLEIQVLQLAATESSHYAHLMLRFGRHETRLDRIERRLELVET